MSKELEVYGDDDGIMIIGDSEEVSQALAALDIDEKKTKDISQVKEILHSNQAKAVTQGGMAVVKKLQTMQQQSGRWVKLTKDTAEKVKKHGLVKNNKTGNFMGVIGKGGKGNFKGNVQFESLAGAINPASLAGAQTIMVTMAIQQVMSEMIEYLKSIDVKVDQILRQQKDAQFAKYLAVQDIVIEAENELRHTNSISELTWNQLQGTAVTVHEVFNYALLQLKSVSDDISKSVGDTRTTKDALIKAHSDLKEWLGVAADCLVLRNRLDQLKITRYIAIGLDAEEMIAQQHIIQENLHARYNKLIAASAAIRQQVIDAVEGKDATMRVVFLPFDAPVVMKEGNEIVDSLARFEIALGNEKTQAIHFDEKQWNQAMGEVGQGIADGTAQLAKQTGEAAQHAIEAADNVRKQVSDNIGKAANDMGNQIKKAFGWWR